MRVVQIRTPTHLIVECWKGDAGRRTMMSYPIVSENAAALDSVLQKSMTSLGCRGPRILRSQQSEANITIGYGGGVGSGGMYSYNSYNITDSTVHYNDSLRYAIGAGGHGGPATLLTPAATNDSTLMALPTLTD